MRGAATQAAVDQSRNRHDSLKTLINNEFMRVVVGVSLAPADTARGRPIDTEQIIAMTRRWLEKSVIGLNLCPFAAAPYRDNRVRFFVSEQRTASGLLEELRSELSNLRAADPRRHETTLVIHPWVLADFIEYNEFLDVCDAAVRDLGLEGELQVASFHPQYQFADTQPDDISNYTNRSPFPTLHLLRESSVERAVALAGDTDQIYRRNIRTLQELGHSGWQRLWRD
jgi:uncharacterized protein